LIILARIRNRWLREPADRKDFSKLTRRNNGYPREPSVARSYVAPCAGTQQRFARYSRFVIGTTQRPNWHATDLQQRLTPAWRLWKADRAAAAPTRIDATRHRTSLVGNELLQSHVVRTGA
jgi:hypothetical protein